MNSCSIAALLLVAPALTACTTAFEILPSEVPHLRAGTVHSTSGREKTVGAEYLVRFIPHDGAVLLNDPTSPDIVAFPEYDKELAGTKGFKRVSELRGPIRSAFGGRYITAVDDSFRVWAGSVKEIIITRPSPGRPPR